MELFEPTRHINVSKAVEAFDDVFEMLVGAFASHFLSDNLKFHVAVVCLDVLTIDLRLLRFLLAFGS